MKPEKQMSSKQKTPEISDYKHILTYIYTYLYDLFLYGEEEVGFCWIAPIAGTMPIFHFILL